MSIRTACLAALVVLTAGCDDDADSTPMVDAAPEADAGTEADAEPGVDAGTDPDSGAPTCEEDWCLPSDCDPLNEGHCAMPWPSSLYLQPDDARETGYTLNFGAETLPANLAGAHIDPAPYRRLDGYGPGTPLLVVFPHLDLAPFAGEWNVAQSIEDGQPLVWLEVAPDGSTTRVPYWAELDSFEDDPARRTLFVRPGVILKENTRYVVGFRHLATTDGEPVQPTEAFAALRDGATERAPSLAPRQARFDEVFAFLEADGVTRDTLTLAWDFHTGSSDGLHGRMLQMRDEAFATVEGEPVQFTVTATRAFTVEENPNTALEVEGTFRVPHYMKENTAPDGNFGWVFNLDGDDEATAAPVQDGWREAEFWMQIPHSALEGDDPIDLLVYGHGLFGRGSQALSSYNDELAQAHRFIFFGASMVGMSEREEEVATTMLEDLSLFPWIADRLHQGMLEYLLLARAMPANIGALEGVADLDLEFGELYYMGISQGGIFGATFMALTPDVERGHLGVPGQNYSTLLHRSVDFTPFFAFLEQLYPGRANQAVVLSTIQLLWDAIDPVSHYRHITADPFPGNDPHYVLAAPARGDYQVATVTMEVVARSDIGIALMENYDDAHVPTLVEETPYPHAGSGITMWHHGNDWGPRANIPPDDALGDPHGKPRRNAAHNEQLQHFLRTGEIIDTCDGGLCPPPEE